MSSSETSLSSEISEETDLKIAMEKATTYAERSKIRAQIRELKKAKGEMNSTTKPLQYTRAGHQILPTNFKSDTPSYYQAPSSSTTSSSNRRSVVFQKAPTPKHWIPGMMTPVDNNSTHKSSTSYGVPKISSERSQSCGTELEAKVPIERCSSHDLNRNDGNEILSETSDSGISSSHVIHEHYSAEYNDGYQEFNQDNLQIQQREDPIGSELSPTDNDREHTLNQDEIQESGHHDEQQHPVSDPTSNERRSSKEVINQVTIESNVRSEQPTAVLRTKPVKNISPAKNNVINEKTDELDLLYELQCKAQTEEELADIRKRIKEAKRIKYRRHSSHIQIEVKKNQSTSDPDNTNSSTSSPPPTSPLETKQKQYDTNVIDEVTEETSPLSVNDAQIGDINYIDSYTPSSKKDNGDDKFVDLAQAGDPMAGSSVTGREPQSWGKGQIDFTTVLQKTKSPTTEFTKKRSPPEQRNFKDVLKKADKPQTSPPTRTRHGLEQQDFRHLLKNRVKTNNHKNNLDTAPKPSRRPKSPPSPPNNDTLENNDTDDNTPTYDESLPKTMIFDPENEHRLEPEQTNQLDEPELDKPTQECSKLSPHRNTQQDEQKSNVSSVSIEDETFDATKPNDDYAEANSNDADAQNQDEIWYRRQSLELRQHSRKKHQEFQRRTSLSKIRKSLNEETKVSPDHSIPEEISKHTSEGYAPSEETPQNDTETIVQNADEVSHSGSEVQVQKTEEVTFPKNDDQNSTENVLSTYQARKEARKKQRENSKELDPTSPTVEVNKQAKSTGSRSRPTRDTDNKGSPTLTAREKYLQSSGVSPQPIARVHSPKPSPNSPSSRILSWVRRQTVDYNIEIKDLSTSWKDGLAFCALLHSYVPERLDFDSLTPKNAKHNLELAFDVAYAFGVEKLIDPEDIMEMDVPDTKSIMTYLSSIHEVMNNLP